MLGSIRQWFYPKEFRIKASRVPIKNFSIKEVIQKFEGLVKGVSEISTSKTNTSFIKEVATSVWRLAKRMEQYSDNPEFSRAKRALNLMKDVLKEYKIEIKDFTGKPWRPPYDEMPWDDVKGGPMQKEGIIRMAEPQILWHGALLQRGKIIIEERR